MINLFDKKENKSRNWIKIQLKEGEMYWGENKENATVVFVTNGCVSISINQFENKVVDAGNFFLIPSRCLFKKIALTDVQLIVFHFQAEILFVSGIFSKELVEAREKIICNFSPIKNSPFINVFLRLVDKYMQEEIDSSELFELKKQEFFLLLSFCYPIEDVAKFLYSIINEDLVFEKFILDNFLNAKNIDELASLASLSTSGFIKKFQRHFNESPYKWISRKKAEYIYFDMKNGILSLQEIAHKYRFSSYSRLADFCKVQFGISPSVIYKKSAQNI